MALALIGCELVVPQHSQSTRKDSQSGPTAELIAIDRVLWNMDMPSGETLLSTSSEIVHTGQFGELLHSETQRPRKVITNERNSLGAQFDIGEETARD
jgi:hypothetical protein